MGFLGFLDFKNISAIRRFYVYFIFGLISKLYGYTFLFPKRVGEVNILSRVFKSL